MERPSPHVGPLWSGRWSEPVADPPAPPRASFWKPLIIGLLVGTLLIGGPIGGVTGGVVGSWAATRFAGVRTTPVVTATTPSVPAQPIAAASTDLTALYEQVVKSVAQVNVRTGRGSGIGSALVVDQNGHLLTNNHVVEGATQVTIRFANGQSYPARVLGRDPAGDLAVLEASLPASIPPLPLADSDQVKPGQRAIAIGSPEGLSFSITAGIVSGVDRTAGAGGSRPLSGLIQTDAAINPGNSGGPLLNERGEVIGVITLGTTNLQNIGFAIPSNTARRLLSRLIAGEIIQHPWLGITAAPAENSDGVLVADVAANSPASRAGLRPGDVITSLAGKPTPTLDELRKVLDEQEVGRTVPIEVRRGGQRLTLSVTLQAWPAQLP
ncbi:MAG: 2-alkenal reductase [Dehalococcoidia bacterium]|nr:MAG: 2-alkenal reductase [Dehalococcoidia bacterium]